MATSSAKNKSSDDPILQWVTFKLAGETYGINVMQVQEVLRYSEIARYLEHRLMYWALSISGVMSLL